MSKKRQEAAHLPDIFDEDALHDFDFFIGWHDVSWRCEKCKERITFDRHSAVPFRVSLALEQVAEHKRKCAPGAFAVNRELCAIEWVCECCGTSIAFERETPMGRALLVVEQHQMSPTCCHKTKKKKH